MCSRTYISTERERQRNSGQPVLRWRFYRQDNIIRKAPCVCSVMFSWTFAVAPLVAAPRLLKGRSVGKAILRFLYLLRTANARHGRAHQSDASARIFCVLRRVFWSPQGHLVGDAASGRACILCAPARSKERGASPQNLRTSAPFVVRHCLWPRSTFYRSVKTQ